MTQNARRSRRIRLRLWQSNPYCRYCRRPVPFRRTCLDHIQPRSAGGGDGKSNLALVCRKCDRRKADLRPGELLRWAWRVFWTAQALRIRRLLRDVRPKLSVVASRGEASGVTVRF